MSTSQYISAEERHKIAETLRTMPIGDDLSVDEIARAIGVDYNEDKESSVDICNRLADLIEPYPCPLDETEGINGEVEDGKSKSELYRLALTLAEFLATYIADKDGGHEDINIFWKRWREYRKNYKQRIDAAYAKDQGNKR